MLAESTDWLVILFTKKCCELLASCCTHVWLVHELAFSLLHSCMVSLFCKTLILLALSN